MTRRKYTGPSKASRAMIASKRRFHGLEWRTRTSGTPRQIGSKFPLLSGIDGERLRKAKETAKEAISKARRATLRTAWQLGRIAAWPAEMKEAYEAAKKERPWLTPQQFFKEQPKDSQEQILERARTTAAIGVAPREPEKKEPAPQAKPGEEDPIEYQRAKEESYTPENLVRRLHRLLIAKARREIIPVVRQRLERERARLEQLMPEVEELEAELARATGVGRMRLLKRRNEIDAELRRMGGKTRKWIQKAIKKPGVLRMHVQRTYGAAGFDGRGRIKLSVLRQLTKDGIWGKRARLAILMHGFRKRGGKREKTWVSPSREVYEPEAYERWKEQRALEMAVPPPKITQKEARKLRAALKKRKPSARVTATDMKRLLEWV